MTKIQEDLAEFRRQLEIGSIQEAYRALITYMTRLRARYKNEWGEQAVSGLYQGYLDMTYFALFPPSLKPHGLKVAIVFNYNAFRFEAWLSARNRQVQRHYWELFRDYPMNGYRLVAPASGIDSIVESLLADDFDLGDPEGLTERIETRTAAFVADMEQILSRLEQEQPATETD